MAGSISPGATTRSAWGAPSYNPPSRFLDELPVDLVDWKRLASPPTQWTPSTPSASAARSSFRSSNVAARSTKGTRAVVSLSPGDRVNHDMFGLGTVVAIDGDGDKAQASVDFGGHGVKRLLLRYAPVEKL